jgi:tetratricopeptide (TPR) repeat protein
MLGRDADAERGFDQAIRLQGGLEAAFHGHAMLARHFLRKARRFYEAGDESGTVEALKLSAAAIEKANEASRATADDRNERVFIHESLGASLEAAGDWEGALEAYDLASSVPGGSTAHFRAGRLLAVEAGKRWMKRQPEEALFLFLAAKERIEKSHGVEVPGFTAEQRRETYQGILTNVQSLQAGRISPKVVPLGQ